MEKRKYMSLEDLKTSKDYKIITLDHFKSIVIKAVERTCHWKKFGDWLHEEYIDNSDDKDHHCYKATVIVTNDCFNEKTPTYRLGCKNVSSITIFDIFYTDISGGRFFIEDITLHYEAINSLFRLQSKNIILKKGVEVQRKGHPSMQQ